MKYILLATIAGGLTLNMTGCVTPASPTVASLGAGSDAAYLNSNRGRCDAQISAAQARQYSTQRQQVFEEMQLEQQKRNNTTQNINNVLGVGMTILSGLR